MTEKESISHAVFRVARLHRMVAGQLLRQVGLHPGQELVMMHLWNAGPQRLSDLVQAVGSDAATMTRTVQRLEHAGFVRRRPCEADKRVVIVEPTSASLALRDKVEQMWDQLDAITVCDLPEEESAEALRVLRSLERNLLRAASRDA
ncbi:MarR family winged helix-turn-helix transcriptional regulator [Actinoplanes subglobosus]|uniref:MarR family winged helix-turn-helix transcriptional regulator n=1 Tax=Actinoplanes subglobosus TaxID=1547892 RepID=A0ABV8II22_9ACTN